MWISFNINSYVRVQLTDEGKRLMRRNHREKFPQLEYCEPEEDTEGWSKWPYRGKPAKDSPRYKALGNSMAIPPMRWIGERIQMVSNVLVRKAA